MGFKMVNLKFNEQRVFSFDDLVKQQVEIEMDDLKFGLSNRHLWFRLKT